MVDEPHRAAHQMGRAERLAPRVVVRVARSDLKVVVRGEGVDFDAVLDEQPRRPEVQWGFRAKGAPSTPSRIND